MTASWPPFNTSDRINSYKMSYESYIKQYSVSLSNKGFKINYTANFVQKIKLLSLRKSYDVMTTMYNFPKLTCEAADTSEL